MAWNEPGGPKDNDPWGSSGGGKDGPPDLDEAIRKFQEKLSGIFGGGRSGGQGGSGKGSPFGFGAILLLAVVIWALSGLYIVDEGWRGVVLRFGKYAETTEAGLHWYPRLIEQVELVNVENIRNVEIGYRSGGGGQSTRSVPREALMLTQDENIIDIEFAIQYRVKDAKDYLFNVKDPDETLHQATESAVREVIGKSTMDFVLTEGRSEIVVRAEKMIQEILDRYQAGLLITSVNMQDAQPPEQVQAAFSDAVKAREDEVRQKNEAEAYSNDIIPKARGRAARMLEEANAYRERVIAEATGDASRFQLVLAEYKKAPQVTRERLYLDAIEKVLDNSSKVMVDVKGGSNLLYLPFDRLMQRSDSDNAPTQQGTAADSSAPQSSNNRQSLVDQASQRLRSTLRQREAR